MSFLDNLAAYIPFLKKSSVPENFFALNIGLEKIKALVFSIEGNNLKVLNSASGEYSSIDEVLEVTDKLLDQALGSILPEPEKILFGVPDSFLVDEELKDPQLKLLQEVCKSLSLTPMAYVATSHAVAHLLDKKEGGPTTAILVEIGKEQLSASVIRAGKVDATKIVRRGENVASDTEKALLNFTDVEVLPSRILIYSSSLDSLEIPKEELLAFSWMNKLPFLHIPKIDMLESDVDISGVALAGAVEINPQVQYTPLETAVTVKSNLSPMPADLERLSGSGFITGDIEESEKLEDTSEVGEGLERIPTESGQTATGVAAVSMRTPQVPDEMEDPGDFGEPRFKKPGWLKIPNLTGGNLKFLVPVLVLVGLVIAYLLIVRAEVVVFVEPKVLEKDAQVVADPKLQKVDEANKRIPGQIVETEVRGTDKISATGSKQIGDSAKGMVKVINNSAEAQTLSQGSTISASGVKFTLDSKVNIASTSATSDSKSTVTVGVTAVAVGADGNVVSNTQFTSSNPQVAIVAEGNFSGGTSKTVSVVTDSDQKKLLAQLATSLRREAQQQLQAKLTADKKILEEALTEDIIKKAYTKNINDQAGEFSLNLIIKYKGIVYSDSDLKTIVSKLVDTNIPEGYQLDLNDTETQADVSKQVDGQLIFLARFKAKLAPKLDLDKIKNEIKGQTPARAAEILKSNENILESEINLIPALPIFLTRLPLLPARINLEVKLK